ncbi:MAG: FAD-dependent monooxygenase, partial [Rhodovibrionaceae bacterium]
KRLVDVDPEGDTAKLSFADGTSAEAEIVVGADGVNSMVREILLGPEKPIYTGHVGHRAIFPVSRLRGLELPDITKWWAEDRHLVVYFVTANKEEIYFVSGVPEPEWTSESSWVDCDVEEIRSAFDGFHPEVQALIDACPAATKWAFFERKPLPLWNSGRIVLLGDACHPMKPHMGQGAAMAIEDAAMLARCFDETPDGDFQDAFALYAANRMQRTERVQNESRENTWLKFEQNPDWVFDYDVFEVPLVAHSGQGVKTGTGS